VAGSFRGTTIGLLTAVAMATGCAKEPATSDSSTPSQPSTPPAVVALSIEGSPAPIAERVAPSTLRASIRLKGSRT